MERCALSGHRQSHRGDGRYKLHRGCQRQVVTCQSIRLGAGLVLQCGATLLCTLPAGRNGAHDLFLATQLCAWPAWECLPALLGSLSAHALRS